MTPPCSKSQSIRAIILASLCRGISVINNIQPSEDIQQAIAAGRQLCASITTSQHTLTIENTGLPLDISDVEIFTGNSGVTTHLIMPILGLRQHAENPVILNCGAQMRARPIKPLVEALKNLGLTIHYLENENTLPIKISGKLMGGKTTVDGTTSQYLSALLIALPCASKDSVITVDHLQERPYVEMTMQFLKKQNIQFHHNSFRHTDTYYIQGRQRYQNFSTTISGDFSAASYLIAAAVLIPGEIILNGLSMDDVQGDKQLITILKYMGADITIEPTRFIIRGGKKLTGIKIDASDIPDLLPTLAVIGTYAAGKTEIKNCAHARMKETDRIHSMSEGLKRMGAKIIEENDGLTINESTLQGCLVKGYGDHRTVMAFSIAGMIANGATIIDDAEAIHKTFPDFVKTMQSVGAKLEMKNEISA